MRLTSLSLQGFRSYDTLQISFHKGIHCFYGDNAQGKTNLLEAIAFLSTGRSFRTHILKELIHKDHKHFYLGLTFEKEGLSHDLKVSYDGEEKRIHYNGQHYPNFYPLFGLIPLVLLCPEDIELIQGGPQIRRRFMDFRIAQSSPIYLEHLTRYHQALRQRNALLKLKQTSGIAVFEELMAISAEYIALARITFLESLEQFGKEWLKELSGNQDTLTLRYHTHSSLKKNLGNYRTTLLVLYQELREKEFLLGQTLVGPHREDFEILLNDQDTCAFSSEGQKRMVLLALKFAESSVIEKNEGILPLFAFDDFGVHLDEKRKTWATKAIEHFEQVFITSTTPLPSIGKQELFYVEKSRILNPEVSVSSALKETALHPLNL